MERTMNNEEMISFCSQMAVILHSGISAFEGISMMMEDQEGQAGASVLQTIYSEMELGRNLYDGIVKTEVFPEYACQMVQLGETSGRLDEVMRELAEYYSEEQYLADTIRRAVSYPLFMLTMMLGVLFVLMVKVMPVFEQVYQSLGTGMSGPAGAVLHMGQVMGRYSGIFLALLGVILIAFWWLSGTKRGRAAAAGWMKSNRAFRGIVRQVGQYRLASGMSMCLRSGLDPQRSLELMEQMVEDGDIAGRIAQCREKIMQGAFFEEALVETDVFDKMHNRMIRVGQRTGSLDQVMEEIAVQCRKESSDRIWHKISLIEPTVVIALAVLVGVILLSVMLPLMSIMSQMG